jgi:DNA-binding PadR family transcriptional regulator
LNTDILKKLQKRIVRSFMDVLILAMLRNNNSMSGYDVIAHIHKKFDVLVSSGTVYSILYSLERDGLIKGVWNQRRRVYTLTEKGKQTIKTILKADDQFHVFLRTIFGRQDN